MKKKKKLTFKKLNRKSGGLTHREIASLLGISRSRVVQLEQTAMAKLAHPKNAKILKQFLEG